MSPAKATKTAKKSATPKSHVQIIEMDTPKSSRKRIAKIRCKPANADITLQFLQNAIQSAVEKYGATSFRGTLIAYK